MAFAGGRELFKGVGAFSFGGGSICGQAAGISGMMLEDGFLLGNTNLYAFTNYLCYAYQTETTAVNTAVVFFIPRQL